MSRCPSIRRLVGPSRKKVMSCQFLDVRIVSQDSQSVRQSIIQSVSQWILSSQFSVANIIKAIATEVRRTSLLVAQQLYNSVPGFLFFFLSVNGQGYATKNNQTILKPTNQTKTNRTKPNWIQPSILKELRCPKVLHNSCTNLYFSFFT